MVRSSIDFHPSRAAVPVHVGLIPDGSRRWSARKGISIRDGYDHAMQNLTALLTCFFEKGVRLVSVYMSSIQNFRRTSEEIDAFCRSEAMACKTLFPDVVRRFGLDVKVAGNLDTVPKYLREELACLLEKGNPRGQRRLSLCIAYDPFDELEHAIRTREGVQCLANHLWIPEPLDLIIRTGGANLISNFLPLQAGFARLYFKDALFNDFTAEDLKQLLDEFQKLSRQYGE